MKQQLKSLYRKLKFLFSGKNKYYCIECDVEISNDENRYSNYNFGKPLCRYHQKIISKKISPQAKVLYNEIRKQGIDCVLEDNDGYKSVDLSLNWAQLDIEVDGKHHIFDEKQMFKDILRANYSRSYEDYPFETIRIPNASIDENPEKVAKSIIYAAKRRYMILNESNKFKKIFFIIVRYLIALFFVICFLIGMFTLYYIIINL